MYRRRVRCSICFRLGIVLLLLGGFCRAAWAVDQREIAALRAAIVDLNRSFGERYDDGPAYLARLDALTQAALSGDAAAARRFGELKREALLANPLLDFDRLLLVRRQSRSYRPSGKDKKIWYSAASGVDIGLPSNHECNSSLPRTGWHNEIALLSPVTPNGRLTTLYRPDDGGYVGEVDVDFDAGKMLFTRSDAKNWKIWQMAADGSGLRQVSQAPQDVDCFDPCWLPDGRIVFGSTASYQAVPCWHGQKWVSNLYLMNPDGSGVRQLCFDQDHNFHPSVLANGQVLYHRWDYTGINHIFFRQLMVMNPDGSGQRAVYGTNSWYPNSLYFPRALPGSSTRLIAVLSGYHGVHRMGQLVTIDSGRGWYGADGLVRRISGRGHPIEVKTRDALVNGDSPLFLHPYPLSDKYFLVACWPGGKRPWGIYLADVFDNLVLLIEEPGYALLEPLPLVPRKRPRAIPGRADLARHDATVYLHDVYVGPGLEGVPRGTVKSLRILAYHFGYRGLAGPDKVGCAGPWEVMRILGTVPLEEDGSALFRVPANTPLAVQPLDVQGKAVQLMRSWFTAMPGETLSCVGCHEEPADVGHVLRAEAALRPPREIEPWYGPSRGFDFAREVQPVLDHYCVSCHDGRSQTKLDLRAEDQVPGYRGTRFSDLGQRRLHPDMKRDTRGMARYTPSYEALLPYLRRVSIEDDVSLLVPGEYHADTSPLVQLLRKGHGGVELDAEAWDRLVTWIDLNAPCHGTWGEVYPIPGKAHQRRMALRRQYGGPMDDPEVIPPTPPVKLTPVSQTADTEPGGQSPTNLDRPTEVLADEDAGPREMSVDLGEGVTLRLVRIPAGDFIMGDADGLPDEQPLAQVRIDKPFWMGACEVTNRQFRRFDPDHDSRYYQKRHARADDKGMTLDEPLQPVVRVSWKQARDFCDWLSKRTGMRFDLPTEAQWEYAARAGGAAPLCYGSPDDDFSSWANLGDKSFSVGLGKDGRQATGGLVHMVLEGAGLADNRYDDRTIVTAEVGSYRPNASGLFDMHGNAAEWTRSAYRAYPYRDDDGRNETASAARRVVRGGSFYDPPARCRTGFRLDYPDWQRVFNVGFRVVIRIE